MMKLGLTLLVGLSGLAIACTGVSKDSNQKKTAKQGADGAMGVAAGRWGGPGRRDGRRGRGPQRLLRLLDTDGDGVISKEELAQAGKSVSKLDVNGDGKLTPDELRPKWRRGRWGMHSGRGWRGGRRGMGGPGWRGGMNGMGGPGWRGGMGGPGCPWGTADGM